ncbi:MAG: class I SAM-dependent methyltransferase [Gemmataceae bacterium]
MPATERLRHELRFHDEQAQRRALTFAQHPEMLRFTDDEFLDHETWIRPAFEKLGLLPGRRVLDYGCGPGLAAVVLARRGAVVTALDLSAGLLHEAADRAEINDVSFTLVQADGERLPFADHVFDAIWGNAILHHLDLTKALPELRRVLRPGGVAVFCEPWGGNPLLNLVRERLPYPGKERTPDEQPLRMHQVRLLRRFFPRMEAQGYQLFSMVRRVLPVNRLVLGLDWMDRQLLPRAAGLQRFCRYVVFTLRS